MVHAILMRSCFAETGRIAFCTRPCMAAHELSGQLALVACLGWRPTHRWHSSTCPRTQAGGHLGTELIDNVMMADDPMMMLIESGPSRSASLLSAGDGLPDLAATHEQHALGAEVSV